jgi:hypothetical protein
VRLRLVIVAAALAVAGGAAGTASAGAAGFAGSYFASAVADGVRLTFIAPSASLSDTAADVGGPSAQATLDSLGTSRAFGSFPYPGETAVTSTGLVRTLSGVPAPDYPLYANSDYPIVTQQEIGSGIFALRAESGERRAAGSASVGLAVEGAGTLGLVRSVATTDATGDAVVSEAASTIEGLSIGPLRLAHVVSTATVSLGPDGQLTRRSATDVVGATVAGTDVTIAADGLHVGEGAVPAPPAAPVNEALKQAGITIEFVQARDLPTGVVAPAVRITQEQQSGTKLIYTLGAAQASAGGEGVGADLSGGPAEAGDSQGAPGGSEPPPSTATAPGSGPATPPPAVTPEPPLVTGSDRSAGGVASAGPDLSSPRSPAGFVVPDAGSPLPGATPAGPTFESARPAAPRPAPTATTPAAGRRAAALTALIGSEVDSKPVYGAFAIAGVLGLALFLAMRGLTGGLNR